MPHGEQWFNNTLQEEMKKRSLSFTGPGGSTWHALRGQLKKSNPLFKKNLLYSVSEWEQHFVIDHFMR